MWTPTNIATPAKATATIAATAIAVRRPPLRAFGGRTAITSVGAAMTSVRPATSADAVSSWLPNAAAKSAQVA